MIEQNTVAAKHIIALTIVLHDPVTVEFGYGIRGTGMERGGLLLGYFGYLAEELGGAGLIDLTGLAQSADTNGFQQTEGTDTVNLGGIFGYVEADLDMALGCKVIDLRRLDFRNDTDQGRGVGHVSPVKVHEAFSFHIPDPFVKIEMFDSSRIEGRRTAECSMHFISFVNQELCQIRTVLACNTRY
jgi:hypothetical protein